MKHCSTSHLFLSSPTPSSPHSPFLFEIKMFSSFFFMSFYQGNHHNTVGSIRERDQVCPQPSTDRNSPASADSNKCYSQPHFTDQASNPPTSARMPSGSPRLRRLVHLRFAILLPLTLSALAPARDPVTVADTQGGTRNESRNRPALKEADVWFILTLQ